MRRIVILHTNDIHGHLTPWQGWEGELQGRTMGGFDWLAAAVSNIRKDYVDKVLLLDAGDLIGDTMVANRTKGAALITVLNNLHYHALTIGNHATDFSMEELS